LHKLFISDAVHGKLDAPLHAVSELGEAMRKRRPWFRKAPPFAIEFLEDRVTPASFFEVFDGTLTVRGSWDSDAIRVSFQDPDFAVSMNSHYGMFPAVAVLRLQVFAFDGNDTIAIAQNVFIRALVIAGPGNDFVQGGSGDDVIGGGLGDDTIFGGAGNDEIDGDINPNADPAAPFGPQAIAAMTESADTSVRAELDGTGDATTTESDSRAGNDQIFGEAGDDTARGGGGDDLIIGGTGNDRLFGDDGSDTVRGDSGADIVDGGPGIDRVDGGSGSDTVYGDPAELAIDYETTYGEPNAAENTPVTLARNVDYLFESSSPQTNGSASNGTTARFVQSNAQEQVTGDTDGLGDSSADADWGAASESVGTVGSESTESESQAERTYEDSFDFAADVDGPVAQQVQLLLQGAVLTEATSDGPDHASFISPKRGRRRPTFLYIKPLPLPDLIPDIELPMP
jgi:Ca2+-binding RTX toxin-like protein